MDYKQTTLWQTAFNSQSDGLDPQREKLIRAFDEFRERVALLLMRIQHELPALTLHDITHVDALWRVASEIAGDDYPLNPAEAIVLGGAFLLHDSAHCRAAFPGGIVQIRDTVEWRDAAAQRGLSVDQLSEGSLGFQSVLFDTLRVLHPKQARRLPFAEWDDGNGRLLYLFPHDEIREAYGHIIGEIAESHWWNPHELEVLAEKIVTAPVCIAPAKWTVNPLKIAVLLRVADAAHIDAMRAPRILLAMNHLDGVSRDHWLFQARMNQPHCDNKRAELVFSGSPFPSTEQAAWWLAYDAACLVDKELSAADHLLRDHALQQFTAKEVAGARSPESFARSVPAEGWHPVDASLRISDIQSVVKRFGGAKLYGDEPHLALRELLQNSRDAVMASRALGALNENEGAISVRLEKINGEDWLHVTDTGVGMSRFVLVGVLLDFGRSLWRDSLLRREWPGLAAANFESVGRFGIGFFSVFMLGDQVKVTTLRQSPSQESYSTQWVLEFTNGIHSRPSLRPPLPSEELRRHGTCISVKLADKAKLFEVRKSSFDLFNGLWGKVKVAPLTLAQLVGALAPALEIDVFAQEGSDPQTKVISAGDWREMPSAMLIDRLAPGKSTLSSPWLSKALDSAARNLSPMVGANGEIQGRCAIVEDGDDLFGLQAGIVTVGGLHGGVISGIAGIVAGSQNDSLSRSVAIPLIEKGALSSWADVQSKLLRSGGDLTWKKSARLLALGAAFDELFVIASGEDCLTANQLSDELESRSEIWLLEDREYQFQSDSDEVLASDFQREFILDSRVLVVKNGASINEFIHSTHWPSPMFESGSTDPRVVFNKIVNERWPECELVESVERVVGHVSSVPILRSVDIIYRTKRV